MEFRFYYDENGDFLGGLYDTDPVPSGWVTYTTITPPSYEIGYNPPLEKWSFTKEDWYLPFTLIRLKEYRDSKIAILLDVNNGANSFDVINNIESYTALSRICGGIPIQNLPNDTIMWKNTDGNYLEASYSDIQSLFRLCYLREQNCRKAEAHVLSINSSTPYIDLGDAEEDFNNYLGE